MQVTISGMAWLRTSELAPHQLKNLREQLTIQPRKTTDIAAAEDPDPIYLYQEDEDRGLFGTPRAFYMERQTLMHNEVVDVSYGEPMQEGLETLWRPDGPYKEQEDALRFLESKMEHQPWGGFILKAGCGFGKTITAIELARRFGKRTLILVHKEFFLKQWTKAIKKMMPDARVGLIRQDRCDYDDCDFVIGMIQSLAKDDYGKKYPREVYEAFGMVITDECHRIGASTWAAVLPRFSAAWRVGLTATDRRKDGAQNVFFYHIGPVVYRARTAAMIPQLRKVYTGSLSSPIDRGSYHVERHRLTTQQILSQLVKNEFRNRAIADDIVEAIRNGRKIMVVSERLEHLRRISLQLNNMLMDMDFEYNGEPFIPVVDCYTGEWYAGGKTKGGKPKMLKRSEEDLAKAERANVILATKQMVEEGLDIQALDVLELVSPLGDVEQAVGRVRRWCEPDEKKCEHFCPWRAGACKGKPQPIVTDYIDEHIPQAARRWKTRQRHYKEIGCE